jgi:hypothetical protein
MQRRRVVRVLGILFLVSVGLLPLRAGAQSADLPNENLPGNSPTLPNSNLPGSMPDDNPVSLPNTDTSRAVIQPFDAEAVLYPPGSNVPVRNPSVPPTPLETVQEQQRAAQEAELARQAAVLEAARLEAQLARDQAAAAQAEAAAARDEAAAARDQAAAVQDEAAAFEKQQEATGR